MRKSYLILTVSSALTPDRRQECLCYLNDPLAGMVGPTGKNACATSGRGLI